MNFFIGSSTRMSPEAPVPVIKHMHSNFSLGGAGNVLSNLSNLKNNVLPLSILGKDKISKKIINLIKKKRG
jgi:D-beta-D-heptose 7-phosphate kinase/D-beta-D-heptose 1-phosphate adenosyltransferase